jgi:hypothetical protein
LHKQSEAGTPDFPKEGWRRLALAFFVSETAK